MAAPLGAANDQSLGHFLANTPWDPVPVGARLARKMHKAIDPAGWVADDSGFTEFGRMSPCVARQCTGTVGKNIVSTVKVKHIHRHRFATRTEACIKISTWIVDFYNRRRRHSACDGMSPIDYERFKAEAQQAKPLNGSLHD